MDLTAAPPPPGARRPRRSRLAAAAPVAASVLALAILVAACGGGTTPGVAHLSNTSTHSHTRRGRGRAHHPQRSLLAFSQCMQTHGVPRFPDPVTGANGQVLRLKVRGRPGAVPDSRSPQFRRAQTVCAHLLPGTAAEPPLSAQQQLAYLHAAACMRSQGEPAFPDPILGARGNVRFPIPSGMAVRSLPFLRARTTCQRLLPPGSPYREHGS